MIDAAPHPLYPGRNRSGQFVVGHKKIGGRRKSGFPRRWTQKIQRLFQKIENRRARHERRIERLRLQINTGA
jgi:hypothetical protein